ncbi:DUF4349 domain-containing protein [Streptosporangium sp. NBC_01755]|uniref:DUF4349 domain-containing protein n=1 Tax=unclassified Streptosporangium TaxID=2632669 RepID=UPI002DDA9086|nr:MULTISPECIES: DUF4349 domain-containing protein [unclassified Streptosporangium]WSA27516.1 DUF4349 domain-containing protein [Streptosporangium sp. NBC_01810]WSD01013.1 DUF4349 domain-containing protein [Streptosporangium sp. NBC_01755]
MSRFRYGPRLAVSLAGLALLVSACGGGSVQSTSSDEAAPLAGAQVNRQANEAVPQSAAKAEGGGSPQTGQVRIVPQDRAIIYTAEMTVRAKEVTAAADRARQIVTTAGGYLAMENSDAHSDGEGSATLVFKIPPGNYPGTLDRLGKELGTRESLRQNTEDVTEQVADVESRLKSAKAALDSLRTLLKRANTIGEVLEVEREVSNRESELESLQARQKTLASQTSAATLTLNLVGPATVVKKKEDDEPAGFLGGLRTGWNAFVVAVKLGLTLLGVLLPWLIVIVPAWLLTAFLLRLRRNRDRSLTPGPGDTEPGPDDAEEPLPANPRGEDDSEGTDGPVPYERP